MARVITTMNAKASDDTSKRIRRQQAEAREAGRYHGGGRPFGFEASGSVVREDEVVRGVATPLHVGGTTQVWDAEITNDTTGRLMAAYRCTQLILYPR